jgi:hypothetical protein
VLPDCQNECLGGDQPNPVTKNTEQCLVQNCTEPCGLGTNWSCLSQYSWGTSKKPFANVKVKVTDIVTGNPIAGATVKACSALDDACMSSLGSLTTDAGGLGSMQVTLNQIGAGFFGYVEIVEASDPEALHPTFIFFGKPILHDDSFDFLIATQQDVATIAAQFKANLNPAEGMLFVTSVDCRGTTAPNVHFEVSPSALASDSATFYFNGLMPNPTSLTSQFGTAAFFNLTPGNLNVNEYLGGPSGQSVGGGLAFVQAGSISELVLYPSVRL